LMVGWVQQDVPHRVGVMLHLASEGHVVTGHLHVTAGQRRVPHRHVAAGHCHVVTALRRVAASSGSVVGAGP